MKVVQMVPSLSYGDAVSNDVIALDGIIREEGIETGIYAEGIDNRLPAQTAKLMAQLPELNEDDVILYHFSIGTDINDLLATMKGRKIIRYHNITPAEYFAPYSAQSAALCQLGRKQLAAMHDVPEMCLAVSSYNGQELRENGYHCDIYELPIIIPFNDYSKPVDQQVLRLYDDDWVNFLFVGRIAPNKKQEDVIKAFACYKKYINAKARLFIVGSYTGMECYYQRLQQYVEMLDVKDVIFTGHTSFKAILAYYRLADVFVCMSEHEGFCVPLAEAMCFSVPILAYDKCAISQTLGNGGVLIDDKDPMYVAHWMDRLAKDNILRDKIIAQQKLELERLSYEKVRNQFRCILRKFLYPNN